MANPSPLSHLATSALRLPASWRIACRSPREIRVEVPKGTLVATWPLLDAPVDEMEMVLLRECQPVWLDGGKTKLVCPSFLDAILIVVGVSDNSSQFEFKTNPRILPSVITVRAFRLVTEDVLSVSTACKADGTTTWCPPGAILTINNVKIVVPKDTNLLLRSPTNADTVQMAEQAIRWKHVVLRLVQLLQLLRLPSGRLQADSLTRLGHEVVTVSLDAQLMRPRLGQASVTWMREMGRVVTAVQSSWRQIHRLQDPARCLQGILGVSTEECDAEQFLSSLASALETNDDHAISWQRRTLPRSYDRLKKRVNDFLYDMEPSKIPDFNETMTKLQNDIKCERNEIQPLTLIENVSINFDVEGHRRKIEDLKIMIGKIRFRLEGVSNSLCKGNFVSGDVKDRVMEILSSARKQIGGQHKVVNKSFCDFLYEHLSAAQKRQFPLSHVLISLAYSMVAIAAFPHDSDALRKVFSDFMSRLHQESKSNPWIIDLLQALDNHIRQVHVHSRTPSPATSSKDSVTAELGRMRDHFDDPQPDRFDLRQRCSSMASLLRRFCTHQTDKSRSEGDMRGCGACGHGYEADEISGADFEDIILSSKSQSAVRFPAEFTKDLYRITRQQIRNVVVIGHRIIDFEQSRRWDSVDEVHKWFANRIPLCRRLEELISSLIVWWRRLHHKSMSFPVPRAIEKLIDEVSRLRRREKAHIRQVAKTLSHLLRLRSRVYHEVVWWNSFGRHLPDSSFRLGELESLSGTANSQLTQCRRRRDLFLSLMRSSRRQLDVLSIPSMEISLLEGTAVTARHLRLMRRRNSALRCSVCLLSTASFFVPAQDDSESTEHHMVETERLVREIDRNSGLLQRLQFIISRIEAHLTPLGVNMDLTDLEEARQTIESTTEELRRLLREAIGAQVVAVPPQQLPKVVSLLKDKLNEAESLVEANCHIGSQLDLLRYYADRLWRRCSVEDRQHCRQIRRCLADLHCATSHREALSRLFDSANDDLLWRLSKVETKAQLSDEGEDSNSEWRHLELRRYSVSLSRCSGRLSDIVADAKNLSQLRGEPQVVHDILGEVSRLERLLATSVKRCSDESQHCRRLSSLWSSWKSAKRFIGAAVDELGVWVDESGLQLSLDATLRRRTAADFAKARRRFQEVISVFLPRLNSTGRSLLAKLERSELQFVWRTQSGISEAAFTVNTAAQTPRDAIQDLDRRVRNFEEELEVATEAIRRQWHRLRRRGKPEGLENELAAVEAALKRLEVAGAHLDPVSRAVAEVRCTELRRHAAALDIFQRFAADGNTNKTTEIQAVEEVEEIERNIEKLATTKVNAGSRGESATAENIRNSIEEDLRYLQRMYCLKRTLMVSFSRYGRSRGIGKKVEVVLEKWLKTVSFLEARISKHRSFLLRSLKLSGLMEWWRQESEEVLKRMETSLSVLMENPEQWQGFYIRAAWISRLSEHILHEFGHSSSMEPSDVETVLEVNLLSQELLLETLQRKSDAENIHTRYLSIQYRCQDITAALADIEENMVEFSSNSRSLESLQRIDAEHRTCLALRAAFRDIIDQYRKCLNQLETIGSFLSPSNFQRKKEELQEIHKFLLACRQKIQSSQIDVELSYNKWLSRIHKIEGILNILKIANLGDDLTTVRQEILRLRKEISEERDQYRLDDWRMIEALLDTVNYQAEWIHSLKPQSAAIRTRRHLLRSIVFLVTRFRDFEAEFSEHGGREFKEEIVTILNLSKEITQQHQKERHHIGDETLSTVTGIISSIETRLKVRMELRNAIKRERKTAYDLYAGLAKLTSSNRTKYRGICCSTFSSSASFTLQDDDNRDIILRNTREMMQETLAVNWTAQCLEFRNSSARQLRTILPILMYRIWSAVHDIAMCAHASWMQSQGLGERVRNIDVWLFSLDLKTRPNSMKSQKSIQFWEDVLFQLNSKRKEIYDLRTQFDAQPLVHRGESSSQLKPQIEKIINSFQRLESLASSEALSLSSSTQQTVFNFDLNPHLRKSAIPSLTYPSSSASKGSQDSLRQSPRNTVVEPLEFQSKLPVKVNRSGSLHSSSSSVFEPDSSVGRGPIFSRNTSRESLKLKGSRDSLLPTFQGHSQSQQRLSNPDNLANSLSKSISIDSLDSIDDAADRKLEENNNLAGDKNDVIEPSVATQLKTSVSSSSLDASKIRPERTDPSMSVRSQSFESENLLRKGSSIPTLSQKPTREILKAKRTINRSDPKPEEHSRRSEGTRIPSFSSSVPTLPQNKSVSNDSLDSAQALGFNRGVSSLPAFSPNTRGNYLRPQNKGIGATDQESSKLKDDFKVSEDKDEDIRPLTSRGNSKETPPHGETIAPINYHEDIQPMNATKEQSPIPPNVETPGSMNKQEETQPLNAAKEQSPMPPNVETPGSMNKQEETQPLNAAKEQSPMPTVNKTPGSMNKQEETQPLNAAKEQSPIPPNVKTPDSMNKQEETRSLNAAKEQSPMPTVNKTPGSKKKQEETRSLNAAKEQSPMPTVNKAPGSMNKQEETRPLNAAKEQSPMPTVNKAPGSMNKQEETQPLNAAKEQSPIPPNVKTPDSMNKQEETQPLNAAKEQSPIPPNVKTPGSMNKQEETRPLNAAKEQSPMPTVNKTPGSMNKQEETQPLNAAKEQSPMPTVNKTPCSMNKQEETQPLNAAKEQSPMPTNVKTPGSMNKQEETRPLNAAKEQSPMPTVNKTPDSKNKQEETQPLNAAKEQSPMPSVNKTPGSKNKQEETRPLNAAKEQSPIPPNVKTPGSMNELHKRNTESNIRTGIPKLSANSNSRSNGKHSVRKGSSEDNLEIKNDMLVESKGGNKGQSVPVVLKPPTTDTASYSSEKRRSYGDLPVSQTSAIPKRQHKSQFPRSSSFSCGSTLSPIPSASITPATSDPEENPKLPENRSSMTVLVNRRPSEHQTSLSTVTSYHTPIPMRKGSDPQRLGEIITKLPRLVREERQRREAESKEVQGGQTLKDERLTESSRVRQRPEVMNNKHDNSDVRVKGDFFSPRLSDKKNGSKLPNFSFSRNFVPHSSKELEIRQNDLATTISYWEDVINEKLPKAKGNISKEELRDQCFTLGRILDSLPDQKGQLLALQLSNESYENVPEKHGKFLSPIANLSLKWKNLYSRLQEWQMYLQLRFTDDDDVHSVLDGLDSEVKKIRHRIHRQETVESYRTDSYNSRMNDLSSVRIECHSVEMKLDDVSSQISALQKEFVNPNQSLPLSEYSDRIFAIRDSLGVEKSRINSLLDSNNSTIADSFSPRSNNGMDNIQTPISINRNRKLLTSLSPTPSITRSLEDDMETHAQFSDHCYSLGQKRTPEPREPKPAVRHAPGRYKKLFLLVSYTLPIDLFFLVLIAAIIVIATPNCSDSSVCQLMDKKQVVWNKYWITSPPI